MEMIKYICPIILFIFCILAIVCAFSILCSENRKDTENKLLVTFCFSSAIWSLGFGALILQTNIEWAYYCRVFGMIGTILYLITGQMLVSYLSAIKKHYTTFFNGFACLGFFVYFLTVERSQTIFEPDTYGMTYFFKSGPANTIYTVYSLILAVLMLGISLYMCFSKIKRIRFFGKIFLLTVAAIGLGTVLDTVLPLFGMRAIPGSTLTQFAGLVVVYLAIRANNHSKINITNMSEFIYYSLSMPVLVYNSSKRLQIANDAAAKFFNINQECIPEKNIELPMLFDLTDDSVFDFDGNSSNTDAICIHNQIPCNLAINKIQDYYNDIIGYIIIITDLSERIKTLRNLEEAKQEAEVANHSKSIFLANMSHEIRTPMNAILGFSELIMKQSPSDTVSEYAADIKNSCLNLLTIINDILDISKLDSGKAELSCSNYQTSSLLQDVYNIIHIQTQKKGLHFEMDVDPAIPSELYGDKTRLRGILINLLNNAVKYTEQGSIKFTIRFLESNRNYATLEYSIRDTGIGIKESAMEHLFDSFTRFDLKRNTNIEGTGLGLSIVQGYVNLMKGNIKVDSIYGQGSTFTVTLRQEIVNPTPINLDKSSVAKNNALKAREIKVRDTHVLVTDDNPMNLKVIKNAFEYYGLTVDTASSGTEAIQFCKNTSYDLIFMDQMMPHMDGVETMQILRTLSPHYAIGGTCKIIALTANAILGVRDELLNLGFDEYLSKPVQFENLESLLIKLIPKSKFVNINNALNMDEPTPNIVVPDLLPSAINIQTLKDMLPQLNIATALSYCNNDIGLLVDILHIFYEDSPQQLRALKQFWNEKNYKKFIIQIHILKNQLLNIGYTKLAEDAKALELAAKENDSNFIEEHLDSFVNTYTKFLQQLERVL